MPSKKIPNKPRTNYLRSIAGSAQAIAQTTSAAEWLVQGLCKHISYKPLNKPAHKGSRDLLEQGWARLRNPHRTCLELVLTSHKRRTSDVQATYKPSYKRRTRSAFCCVVQSVVVQGRRTRFAQGRRTKARTKWFVQARTNLAQ